MSWQAIKWAREKGNAYELDTATKCVLNSLAHFAGENGEEIYPSLATLAWETSLSERQVRRCLQKLIEVGLLDYGDQSVVSHFRADRRPKVYDFQMTPSARPDLSSVGRMPAKKKRPWSRKPKPPVVETPTAPVDNSGPRHRRPDTQSRTAGQAGGLSVHQNVKPIKSNPAAPADAGPVEVDHDAVYRLRAAIRERLARQGMVFKDHLFAPMPA